MIVNVTKATLVSLRDALEVPRQPLSLYCRYCSTQYVWLTSLSQTEAVESSSHMRTLLQEFDAPEYWGQDIFIAPSHWGDEAVEENGLVIASVRKPNH